MLLLMETKKNVSFVRVERNDDDVIILDPLALDIVGYSCVCLIHGAHDQKAQSGHIALKD